MRLIDAWVYDDNPEMGIIQILNEADLNHNSGVDFCNDDDYFYNHSGNKETSPLVDHLLERQSGGETPLTNTNKAYLANVIRARFQYNWEKRYAAYREAYEPLENYNMHETVRPDLTDVRTPQLTDTRSPQLNEIETRGLQDKRTLALDDKEFRGLQDEHTFNNYKDTHSYPDEGITTTITRPTEYKGPGEEGAVTETQIAGFNSSTYSNSQKVISHGNEVTKYGIDGNGEEKTNVKGKEENTKTGSETIKYTGTDKVEHTGTDTLASTGTRKIEQGGNETVEHTGSETDRHTGVTTTDRNGNIGVTTSQQMLQAELDVRKYDLIEQIYLDIDTVLTSPFYSTI